MDEQLDTMIEDLREQPLAPVTIGFFLVGQILIIIGIEFKQDPLIIVGLIELLAFVIIWWMRRLSVAVASHLFAAKTLVLLTMIWWWYPDWGVPTLLPLLLVAVSIVLKPSYVGIYAALTSGLVLLGRSFWAQPGAQTNQLAFELAALWSTTLLLYVGTSQRKTILSWAWRGYETSRQGVQELRDRQVELKQALGDVALANKELTRLNSLLAAARQAVEQARHAKEEFVANVSHELRTPLNMIIGFSSVILESPEIYSSALPPTLLGDITTIKRNSDHLAALVDDVLDLSQLDAGSMSLTLQPCFLEGLVTEVVAITRPLLEHKHLAISVHMEENMPMVRCDPVRIRQVLLNLVSNAGRFTEEGGIAIDGIVKGANVEIRVQDTGLGIARDKIPSLFEPFRQADPSIRRRYGGTGLGLALSKRLIELHGGRIWIESEPGRGTTVAFTLPLVLGPSETAPQRWFSPHDEYQPRPARSMAPNMDTKPCVVVLESGNALSKQLAYYMDHIDPISVADVETARQAAENQSAVAIIVADGKREEWRAMREGAGELSFDIPIMSCTLEATAPDRRWGQVPVIDYLVKPVDPATLRRAVSQAGKDVRTIILADDDADARRLFGHVLDSADTEYTVLYAMDGHEALELLHTRMPDLLILDLVMPRIDGYGVLAAMSEDESLVGIPVVIVSALDREQHQVLVSQLAVTRQTGLSARDLAQTVGALVQVLTPRFGPGASPETLDDSKACEQSR